MNNENENICAGDTMHKVMSNDRVYIVEIHGDICLIINLLVKSDGALKRRGE